MRVRDILQRIGLPRADEPFAGLGRAAVGGRRHRESRGPA
ncbi:Uncharacterised protein [Bordetella pertussis]|nr:Uncharacterised protein [Bordetella pertussis]